MIVDLERFLKEERRQWDKLEAMIEQLKAGAIAHCRSKKWKPSVNIHRTTADE